MEPFLLEVPARNQLMKTMFACKSWNTKNLCQMGHAIKGGKLILFQRVVIIFRLELHLWTHPLLLKISSSLLPTISGIFWCFILTSCMPQFALFIYLIPFMLFASMILLDMTKQPLCILLLKHMVLYYLNGKDILYIPYAPV